MLKRDQTHSLEQAGKKLDRHRSWGLQKPRAKLQAYRAGRKRGAKPGGAVHQRLDADNRCDRLAVGQTRKETRSGQTPT